MRGVATVEALAALPFFFILFAAILYVRDRYLALENARVEARGAAWTESWNACPDAGGGPDFRNGPPPPGLYYAAAPPPKIDWTQELRTAVSTAIGDAAGGSPVGQALDDIVDGALAAIVAQVFDDSVDVQSVHALDRPPLFGGKQVAVVGSYHLACNLKPTDFSNELGAAASRLFGLP